MHTAVDGRGSRHRALAQASSKQERACVRERGPFLSLSPPLSDAVLVCHLPSTHSLTLTHPPTHTQIRRNKIVAADMRFEFGTCVIAAAYLVSTVFGQNLHSGYEAHRWAYGLCCSCCGRRFSLTLALTPSRALSAWCLFVYSVNGTRLGVSLVNARRTSGCMSC